jgi:hypothetical protein
MNKNKIIYWTSTGLVSAMMLMSAVMYFTMPEAKEGFAHAGFPDYFRIELGTAKLLGVIALLLPFTQAKVKEWAYAGFGITFISAVISHLAIGDDASKWSAPIVAFILLAVSYLFKDKK